MSNEQLTSDGEGDLWLSGRVRTIWDKFADMILGLRKETRNIVEFKAEPKTDGYDISITEENLLQRPEKNTRTVHINTSGYEPPVDGIPRDGLAEDVRNSLDLADSALQEFTEEDPVYAADKKDLALKAEVETLQEQLTERLDEQLSLLDRNICADVNIVYDESAVFVKITLVNLKTNDSLNLDPIALPTADPTKAGMWDATMFNQFKAMDEAITALYSQISGQPRTAVVSELADDDSETLTAAFVDAVGSQPTEGDRLLVTSNQTEWIYDNDGEWIMLGVIPFELATSTNDGLVSHNDVDGGVVYFVAGKGQVKGWDALKAFVSKNTDDISLLDTSLGELQLSVADNAKLKIFAAEQNTAAQQWSNDNPTWLVLVQGS